MEPNEKNLLDNLGKIAYTLDKTYLSELSTNYGVWYFNEKYNKEYAVSYRSNIRAVQVKKWVFTNEEKPGECFKNVLSAFADGDHTLGMVIKRHVDCSEMFFVIKNEGQARNEESADNVALLKDVLKGNFQGSDIEQVDFDYINFEKNDVAKVFAFEDAESVAVLSNTPSEYSKDHITQGLDKLLEGIVPQNKDEEYTVIFLAESLSNINLREILSGYEDIATAIFPFAGYQFQVGKNQTETEGEMKSISNTKSISDSVFKTHSVNLNINGGINSNHSQSLSDSRSVRTAGVASSVGSIAGGLIGGFVGGPAGAALGAKLGSAAGSMAPTIGHSNTVQSGSGIGIGGGVGYGYSWGKSKTISNGTTNTTGTSSSVSLGKSENTSYTYKSYMVQNLLQKLEETMKRIAKSQSTGLWKFSSYVMAKRSHVSINVANYLRAINQGKESYIEPSEIQEWSDKSGSYTSEFKEIRKYLTHFCHPLFVTVDEASENKESNGMLVTPTSYISTDDLGFVVSFPRKSIQGLPVLEGVNFGREPHSLVKIVNDLDIGNGYHMHQLIPSTRVKLSKEELTKHTFITGSTGSGKTNTIYKILDTVCDENVHFLVIEPAKGEYKQALGRKEGVTVYGTNPKLTDMELLRINPFKFPPSIHVLEHMDRIIEVFNVCWPMYAAMPAILKDSVERAYVSAGWDLETSENMYSPDIFPSFTDVVNQIKIVLDESDYSSDNKGDYTGALVTRLKSLTNGINGLIFTNNDIADEDLFDKNVIIDLSRVGSTETKALIMGLLVLKLQEHRMEQRESNHEVNEKLKHITVLEEAHNLLRRTSTEQATEGANLLGKSVEMLANSIAEMRTYGEGFIIADQSPGLMDMSVIRNTNTKIIMRLPDFSDRELVGKSAGLNKNQIVECARLERGVAAITQSDWLEPVLCKVDLYEVPERKRKTEYNIYNNIQNDESVKKTLLEHIMTKEIYRQSDRVDALKIKDLIVRSNLDASLKCKFVAYIESDEEETIDNLQKLIYSFFNMDQAVKKAETYNDIIDWVNGVVEELNPDVKGYDEMQINHLLVLLINEQATRNIDYHDIFNRFTEIHRREGKVFNGEVR